MLPTITMLDEGYPQMLDGLRAIISHEAGQSPADGPSVPAVEEELLAMCQAANQCVHDHYP